MLTQSIDWDALTTVWFDMGGVILDIDPQLTQQAMTQLLAPHTGEIVRFDIHEQEDLFLDFERGAHSPSAFRQLVRNKYGASCTDAEFDDAWCAVLKQPFPWAFQAVQAAAARYRTALLSNTNAIHFQRFYPDVERILKRMEHVFVSHEMGTRKPEVQIYQLALQAMGVRPQEVLFIEDNAANVAAAQAEGIQVVHLTDPAAIQFLFQN